jgi:uncharacterized protein YhbP (UPF0306 family)
MHAVCNSTGTFVREAAVHATNKNKKYAIWKAAFYLIFTHQKLAFFPDGLMSGRTIHHSRKADNSLSCLFVVAC